MKTSSSLCLLALHFLLTASASQVRAQDLDNVAIAGCITDQNGAYIPGALVEAVLQTGTIRSTSADYLGRYRLIQLRPGIYTLRVSAPGFAVQERRGIVTISAQNVLLNATLFPSQISAEPVVVVATETPVVDTTRTIVGGSLTTHEIESLPLVTRSPLDLIFTLPGVTEEPLSTRDLAEDRNANPAGTPEEAGIFSLSGGPAYSNNITIDGLDNNDDRAARERFQPSLEAVAEVQVITNQFSAEYGRASGGRVNIRTRAGSKDFQGRAYYFFRDEALNANTFRNNLLGLKRLPLQEHIGGFTLGGPAMLPARKPSEKINFFASYELGKTLDSALIDTLVPVQQNPSFHLPAPTSLATARQEIVDTPDLAAEIAPFVSSISTPVRTVNLTARVDAQLSQLHTATFVYQLGRFSNLRQFGGGNRLAEALQAKRKSSDAISFSDSYVFSASLINQIRFQISRLSPSITTSGASQPVVLIALNDPLPDDDLARRNGTLVAGSSTTGASDRREARIQIQNIMSYLKGAHSVKFGFDVQQIRSTFIDLSDASGTFNFASAGNFLVSLPDRFRQNFNTESTQNNTYAGVFAQDEWRPLQNFMVSYGLRYESESIIKDLNNFGPRLAIALDPFNSGRTVLRAGAGIFYNRALLRTIDDFTLDTQRRFFDTNLLRDSMTGLLLNAEQRRAFIAAHLQFPETLSQDSSLVTQYGILDTDFSRKLDPELKIPVSYQYNFGLERGLGRDFSFEANFTFNRGIHLWREFNSNAPILPRGYLNFTEYLASRDFPNFRTATGLRPVYNASSAGELVRFVLTAPNPLNPNAVVNVIESGVPVSLINLGAVSSGNAVEVALAALNRLRPDPGHAEVEQLISAGNSFYRGLTLELRRRSRRIFHRFSFSFRAAYTWSHLIDDGIVNTSDALRPADFRAERSRSLLDRRHRFVFSGVFALPRWLGNCQLAPIWRLASGAPFNISLGGADRNLDDVGNDRPNFNGDARMLRWRRPGEPLDTSLLNSFSLPQIGQAGNLPRNAGLGPGQMLFDLNLTRGFRLGEKIYLGPVVEIDNVFNSTVFSFGSEFVNFSALATTATPEQRNAFVDSFLVATRTMRARQIRFGIRLDF